MARPFGLLVGLALCLVSPAAAQDVRPLAPDETVERELGGGESHAYRITAGSGEYVSLLIEPRGVELKLRLSSPDGQQVAQVESVVEGVSGRTLSVIADRAGDHQLVVSSSSPEVTRGAYQLKVAEWRQPEARDVTRVAAERAVEEAERLDNLRQAEASRTAITTYSAAIALWRAAGDRRGEADTYEKRSSVWMRLSEYQKALDGLSLALQVRREMGDRNGEASTLNEIGESFAAMTEYQRALDHFDQALQLQTGKRYLEHELLNNVGVVYRRLGDCRKAQDYYRRSLAVVSTTGDRRSEANVANNLGVASRNLGEYQQALDSYGQALALFRELRDRDGEGLTLNNLAITYYNLGLGEQAVEVLQQAVQLRRAAGNRFGEANSLSNLGNTYRRLGEADKALEYLKQALTMHRSIPDRAGEAIALRHIGAAHEATGDHEQALDHFRQSIELSRTIGDRTSEAVALQSVARIRGSLGEHPNSRDGYREALRLFRETGDRRAEAATLLGLADSERSLGDLSGALAHIESAIETIELLRSSVASTDLRATYQAANQDYYEFHVDLLMELERERPGGGYDARALQVSERARSRSLLDLLTETEADLRQGADPALIEHERMLIAQINAKDTRRRALLSGSGKRDDARIAAAEKELSELLAQYRQVQADIRARSPRYAALTQPQPVSLREIQGTLLDEGTLLLEYKLGEKRSHLWAVTREAFRSFELPPGVEINAAARQVHELLLVSRAPPPASETPRQRSHRLARVKADYHRAAAALSRMLLAPVADMLGRNRLVIVADGALHYVPFAALPGPSSQKPLVLDHEIVSLPSASVLSVLRQEQHGRARPDASVAVLADPVFGANDVRLQATGVGGTPKAEAAPSAAKYGALERSARVAGMGGFHRLRFSREEALAITGLVPTSRALSALDFKASKATALAPGMNRYGVVHFATHGLLNTEHPELSGLVLSLVDERGQAQDGFLRLHEVYGLELNADLVVLSGCETALGKEMRGEGLIGLTRGFMYAGARRVIASLWNVNDRATAKLMKHFYQGMLGQGMRPAAALREAQLAAWKEQPDAVPHFWAPFVLQGEWR